MKNCLTFRLWSAWFASAITAIGIISAADRHVRAPHGGTSVLVAEHKFHLELVRDGEAGLFQAYVLDDHLEKYVAVRETNFTLHAAMSGRTNVLGFKRAADFNTGKLAPSSSLFEGRADWIKSATNFIGHIPSITLNGRTFTNITFPFPKGTQHTH